MENNIDKWLKECDNPSKTIMTTELSKGMQLIKELPQKAKQNPVTIPKEPSKPITSIFDILNKHSFDIDGLDENIDRLLRHYEIDNNEHKEAVKTQQHQAVEEENISFHLFDENKESFRKIIKSNISEFNNNNYYNKEKEKQQFDSISYLNVNENANANASSNQSVLTESIKFDSEDIDNCLKEFNCYPENNYNCVDLHIKQRLNKIDEEEEKNDNDINNDFSRTNIHHFVNNQNDNDINNDIVSNDNHANSYNRYSLSLNKTDSIEASFVERLCNNHNLADLNEWINHHEYDEEVESVNLHVFGFKTFRPNQREIINANLAGRDIFVCMPTGGGKSLTFQIPAIIQFGVTLVVMPLLSLIQDQTSFLEGLGIKAIFLNTDGMREVNQSYDTLFHSDNEEDLCKLIFLTPEKISQSPKAQNFLQKLFSEKLLKRVVIDEAHCVSQWGREFRPDYLHLKILKRMFPGIPILAVTATAPNKIREDVITQLGMTNTLFFRSSYNRTNLYIEIRNKKNCSDIIQNIAEFIKTKYPNSTGLIYCSSKKNCELVCQKLKTNHKLSCAFYHASLPEKKKNEIQDLWKNDEIKIIIATVAFGMGINKADVRFVIHHSMPKSFESYYQEIGRAGRDGNRSHCILYYSSADRKIIEFLMSKTNLNQRLITENLRKTTEMVEYCEEFCECRRVIALLYFDEKFNRNNCRKMCDNCKKGLQPEETDVTNDCITVLSLLKSCHFDGVEMSTCNLADFLRGIKKKMKRHPSANEFFSSLRHIKDMDIKKILRRLIIWKYIDEHLVILGGNNVYTRLDISEEGLNFLSLSHKEKLTVTFVSKEKKPEVKKEDNANEENKGNNHSKYNKKKFDYQSYKYAQKSQLNQSEGGKRDDEVGDEREKNQRNSSGNSRRYQPNYEKENYNEDNDLFNKDEDYGYCTPIQFSDLFSQLKVKRIELLSEEKKRLINQSTDGNIKKLNLNDIFTENGLKELCRKLPTNESELSPDNIYGVGPKCLEKYGKEFLYIVQRVIKIYQIDKSQQKVDKSMKNINDSRLKKTHQRSGNRKVKEKENEKEDNSTKAKKKEIEIEQENENEENNHSDAPIRLSVDDLQQFLCKSDENEGEAVDYEEFNSFYNNNHLDDLNNIQINNEEAQRLETISLCKGAKKLLKNEKKRKVIEREENDDDNNDDDSSINNVKKSKKEIKIDKRVEYFKNQAKWKKINQYKKNKKFL